MADGTKIEWSDATWGPVVGCTKVSPGCDNCYAERFVNRFAGTRPAFPNRFDTVTLRPQFMELPLRWKKPRRIFVNSLADLFHDDVPDEYIARVFAVAASSQRHTYQILTKRHGRARALLNSVTFRQQVTLATADLLAVGQADFRVIATEQWPLPNAWLGVSVEDQRWADIRIPALLDTPAAVRWVSAEPLLGPVDLTTWLHDSTCVLTTEGACTCYEPREVRLDWVVAGGESGPGARPMHPDWARALRDQCTTASVPYLFKQWGEWAPSPGAVPGGPVEQIAWDRPAGAPWRKWAQVRRVGKKAAGRELDGRTWDEYPQAVTR